MDVGERVVIRTGKRIDVILSKTTTGKDRDLFKSNRDHTGRKKILIVKSTQAHRASFDP